MGFNSSDNLEGKNIMKTKYNLRISVIVGWLSTSAIMLIGIVSGNDVLADVGEVSCGIVTVLASIALVIGRHTELLAGTSEPQELGKYGKIFVTILGIVLFFSGLVAVITPFID